MGRKAAPQPLSLGGTVRPGDESRAAPTGETTVPNSARPPPDTSSPRSPRSPFRNGQHTTEDAAGLGERSLPLADVLHQPHQSLEEHQQENQNPPQPSPRAHAADQHHQQLGHRHPRRGDDKASKSGFFFNFGKAAKASDRPIVHQHSNSRTETMSRDSDRPSHSKQSIKHSDSAHPDTSLQKPYTPVPSRSEVSLASTTDYDSQGNAVTSSSKKSKPKPFTLLGRSRSIKDKDSKDSPSPKDQLAQAPALAPAAAPAKPAEPERPYTSASAPRTAPIQSRDRSFREMMSSAVRNHSAERAQSRDVSGKGRDLDPNQRAQPTGYTPTPGAAFFSNLKHSKAAGILSNRFFGGGSSRNEAPAPKEPVVDDEHYVLKVINLPLVEQTRLTRISKRLEHSRDKTEFWMPAFPWRAIDYLNYKGSEVEGLYRVPGSGPQIKKWQRKFDEELDVDLFEQPDLYDINIIGSMLKAWLRELPDELFPKEAQERIARECAGAEKVPQMLIDELSNLPPFNYYLLFAITCHLSLLLAHSEKNKMDFRNLCICFQPCMKIDTFCFKFLVCDWRDCWKGCKNEAKYIEEEYALFDQPPPKGSGEQKKNGNGNPTAEEAKQEDWNISSSDSNKSPNRGATEQKGSRLKKKPTTAETESAETSSTISTTLTASSEREATPPRQSGDLRPLSPIKPLSPLKF
ncbi:bb20ae07-2eab-4d11-be54-98f5ee273156 [Thermothielavioides terrestris]|uniref:Bb20ae07-2eab-4d11-be54-98f5ee273156 n=1 Tax=Thermothielavioides terrestris TaxID=2587410 RepID=A0A446B7W3_9PEZI|nr:bb20ae07-2eab-4d11-be54-98f5ee273156 [Thermothielavioides terrestris]